MPIRPPTKDDLRELGEELFFDLTEEELEFFVEVSEGRTDAYETVMSQYPPPRLGGAERRERSSGRRVPDSEDPHNAWITQCFVGGDEDALDGDVSDLSIGVLEEGFTRSGAEADVLETVRDTLDVLGECGLTLEDVSLPMHTDAKDIHSVCAAEGLLDAMMGEGLGHGWKAWYSRSWVEMFGKIRRTQGDDFPATLKLLLLLGAYTNSEYHSQYYAHAMNLTVELTERYDTLFETYDLLAMPTTVTTAPEHDPEQNEYDRLRERKVVANTRPFNRTGHPGVSVPAGTVDGCPVGLMLVGERFDDATVLNAAHTLESELSIPEL